jgi:hypothetical protein
MTDKYRMDVRYVVMIVIVIDLSYITIVDYISKCVIQPVLYLSTTSTTLATTIQITNIYHR